MVYMVRRVLLLCLLCTSMQIFSQSKWTLFVYMEASEELQHEALKNISDFTQAGVPEEVNVIVQVHTGGENSWLYKIEGKGIFLLDVVPLSPNARDNIIGSMRKVVDHYPAQHYGVVLWDHGFGILIPQYNSATNTWDVEPDGDNSFGACDLIHVEIPEKKRGNRLDQIKYKGLLINGHAKSVMNNHDMVETFRVISEELLEGKKLDLCGMDCCLGAMIEHGYQLRHYVRYLVGSQDCELTDGWDYTTLMYHFIDGHIDPYQIAQDIVIDYGNYYEPIAPVGRYTQSAIDLERVEELKENLDRIVTCFRQCMSENPQFFKQLVREAREACIRFCQMPAYTDISHFYDNLLKLLENHGLLHDGSYPVQQLVQQLTEGKELVKQVVIANAVGKVNAHAQGISLYFPLYHIDSSYPDCMFARESSWLGFLQKI
ncbi:MAG: hypothetical protein KAS04_06330, partial [Candidatus Aenigmarchaeota archaeon]|nr:hypothetical protein [Candidatus Aenigmarchaeota archaeon]